MKTKIKNSLIDTDIIIKIGGYRKEKILRKILCSFGYNLYIHDYLLQEELIFRGFALEQLNEMIKSKEITVIKECDLTPNEMDEYNSALQLLANNMGVNLNIKRDHNMGEIKSMAMAFAKNFQYFISDDRIARVAAKTCLQKLDGSYIKTIRMRDVIIHMLDNEEKLRIDRKTARQLYIYGTSPKLASCDDEKKKLLEMREKLKKTFDENLWPLE